MKVVKIAVLTVIVLLSGCTVVPYKTSYEACYLLNIAIQESTELSPGWYISAGEILDKCGDPTAKARAEFTACFADKNQTSEKCFEEKNKRIPE